MPGRRAARPARRQRRRPLRPGRREPQAWRSLRRTPRRPGDASRSQLVGTGQRGARQRRPLRLVGENLKPRAWRSPRRTRQRPSSAAPASEPARRLRRGRGPAPATASPLRPGRREPRARRSPQRTRRPGGGRPVRPVRRRRRSQLVLVQTGQAAAGSAGAASSRWWRVASVDLVAHASIAVALSEPAGPGGELAPRAALWVVDPSHEPSARVADVDLVERLPRRPGSRGWVARRRSLSCRAARTDKL